MRTPRPHPALAAMALCLAGIAVPPATARGGTYTVWSCRGPAGEPLPAGAWRVSGDPAVQRGDGCAEGGALVAALRDDEGATDRTPAVRGGYRLAAGDGEAIAGYRVWRVAEVARPHPDLGGAYATLLEDDAAAPGGCFADRGCERLGDARDPLAAGNLLARAAIAARTLAIEVGCPGPGGEACGPPGHRRAELRLFRSAVDIADESPPRLAGAPGGALVGGAPGRGTATIVVDAEDRGGGLLAAEARVDGRLLATAQAARCREPFTVPQPCPAAASFALAIDTTAVPDGAHRLQIAVTDAAGNVAIVVDRSVSVANGRLAPGSAVPATGTPVTAPPGQARERLLVRVERRRYRTGRGAIAGRLQRRDGRPVAGAVVLVERRGYGLHGGGWRPAGRLTTDARGRFRLPVPARARQLRFRAPATAVAASPVAAGAASPAVDVMSRLKLSARMVPLTLRNGDVVVASGRLRGAAGAAEGAAVEVQAVVGGRWKTVGRARADARGRFAWRYRFHNTFLEALYSFRIRVPGSGRWPWAP
ncbi:MAG TPA: carboxypeptidase-like regulatory domain-containing protein, partial [Solirubrobacteraceae bacterium]|nr:carboxypeptidase-like regulatory domain-containing protein [Solirubrobacteraceae bacterium]